MLIEIRIFEIPNEEALLATRLSNETTPMACGWWMESRPMDSQQGKKRAEPGKPIPNSAL